MNKTIIEKRLDAILSGISGQWQNETLFSQAFTDEALAFLNTLPQEESDLTTKLLNDPSGKYPFYIETHDFDKEPFKPNGQCRHGFDWMTCPCGCGSL